MKSTLQQPASHERLRSRYLHFADHEAKGVSPLYEALARAVADSKVSLELIAGLPEEKQQPNLLFAAVRYLYGIPRDAQHFLALLEANGTQVRKLILSRRTQTNEPGRCATLLPALGRLPEPLALLEVGASAGLCLLPDRWGYDYGRVQLQPRFSSRWPAPVFPCRASAGTPLPRELPRIVWRAGLDLDPIDLSDPEAAAWLEALVWPGNEARAERLRAAIRIAKERQPPIRRGDLLNDLATLAATAPRDATLVVFHSAVLVYATPEDRERFVHSVRETGAVWVSNESPRVFPEILAKLAAEPPADRFLLSVDGEPVALTAPHGQEIDWLPG